MKDFWLKQIPSPLLWTISGHESFSVVSNQNNLSVVSNQNNQLKYSAYTQRTLKWKWKYFNQDLLMMEEHVSGVQN